jgi:hypothetical protein
VILSSANSVFTLPCTRLSARTRVCSFAHAFARLALAPWLPGRAFSCELVPSCSRSRACSHALQARPEHCLCLLAPSVCLSPSAEHFTWVAVSCQVSPLFFAVHSALAIVIVPCKRFVPRIAGVFRSVDVVHVSFRCWAKAHHQLVGVRAAALCDRSPGFPFPAAGRLRD